MSFAAQNARHIGFREGILTICYVVDLVDGFPQLTEKDLPAVPSQ